MWHLQLLTAPGDGVAPAAVLTVGDDKRGGQVSRWEVESRGRSRNARAPGGTPAPPPCRPSTPLNSLQYLFNAPEGLSRLALEHKARPSARLRAALVTTLATRGAVS